MMQLLLFPLLMLGMVFALYAAARWLRGRLGLAAGTVSTESLKVVGKRVLEPRKSLYVVEVGERYILVGAAENSLTMIDHISAEEFASMAEPAAVETGDNAATYSFATMLERARTYQKLRKAHQEIA